jgi:large subunit ribosomal protein L24
MYLKRDDLVIVISGDDKGKQGRVIRVDSETDRVWVQGLNMRHKHIRRSQQNPKGGRITKECPLHISKVQLLDSKNKPTRVGFRKEADGRKVRYSKNTNEVLP